MKSNTVLVALAAFAAASPVVVDHPSFHIGIPSPHGHALPAGHALGGQRAGHKGFSVTQVATSRRLRNGAAALQHQLQKFHASVPENVAAAAANYGPPPPPPPPPYYGTAKSSTPSKTTSKTTSKPTPTPTPTPAKAEGSVDADPELYDQAYLSPVFIGTPPQTLMLDFDTGSADLWVFGNNLTAAQKAGHSIYDATLSSSSSLLNGSSWSIAYGDGSGASGNVYVDKVTVGGVTATRQAVEAAKSISSAFVRDTESDGLLGLGFSSINQVVPVKQKTFFDNVATTLPAQLFTVTLKHAAPGHYDFGYINASRHVDTIAYAPVDKTRGYWTFSAGSVYAGNKTIGNLGAVIADTGSSLIMVEDSIAEAYYAQIPGSGYSFSQGGYLIPCNATNLPDFSITVGGVRRSTRGAYLNYAPINQQYCYGGIQSNGGLDFNILGDVFLKSQFAVFDISVPRIGFAPQSPSS